MAGHKLLLLIDDIAALLDDIAVLSKVATKKTAGVLADDLALNAQQVSGVQADRELAVVWAVARGSLLNKLLLVPAALLISSFIPWLIVPLLMLGGLFLCYEGCEKVLYFRQTKAKQSHHAALVAAVNDKSVNLLEYEREKIRGAIRTDFILSAEIIVISLGVVASEPLLTQASVLTAIAFIITVAVYGIVAAIVRLDDWGQYLCQRENGRPWQHYLGFCLLQFAPKLLKTLSVVGTLAMFLVGGGILHHGLHLPIDTLFASIPLPAWLLSTLFEGLLGFMAGLVVVMVVAVVKPVVRALNWR